MTEGDILVNIIAEPDALDLIFSIWYAMEYLNNSLKSAANLNTLKHNIKEHFFNELKKRDS